MDAKEIVVTLAETEMAFRLHFAGTEMPFLCFADEKKEAHEQARVQAKLEKICMFQKDNGCSAAYAEYCCLMMEAGNVLLHFDRMLFHGVAMIYKGRGYILTAPSGTGKSTQFRNLNTLYGKECRIISGDKPVLRKLSEDGFRIYPSPWNGKENWSGKETAFLNSIIWLEQGSDNMIMRMGEADMVLPLFSQIIYTAPDPRTVHEASQMTEGLLRHIPVYKFVNTGDLQSSMMLGDYLDREAEK